jgi:hypothetical protein
MNVDLSVKKVENTSWYATRTAWHVLMKRKITSHLKETEPSPSFY